MGWQADLAARFDGRCFLSEPLCAYTTFKIGGKAESLVLPGSEDDWRWLLGFVRQKGLPLTILGLGSNVIVSDAGLPGVVASTRRMDQVRISGTRIHAQAGAAIGTAIGGMFVIVLSFVIGIPAGIIMHLVAGNYAKKVGADHAKQPETLAAKHGVILSIAALIALAIVLGSVSGAQHSAQVAKEKAELSSSLQQGSAGQNNAANEDNAKAETQSVTLEVVKKDFHAADYMSGSYQDQITMSLKFTNNTEKEVRGVEGVITFYDIYRNIKRFRIYHKTLNVI